MQAWASYSLEEVIKEWSRHFSAARMGEQTSLEEVLKAMSHRQSK